MKQNDRNFLWRRIAKKKNTGSQELTGGHKGTEVVCPHECNAEQNTKEPSP